MAFPTIPTLAAGTLLSQLAQAPAGTHISADFSSLTGMAAGDLLIAICVTYQGGSTDAEFSGWSHGFTEFADRATTATMGIGCAYKWAAGTETGSVSVSTVDTSNNDSCFWLMAIPGAHASTPPEATIKFDATGAAANPSALAPSWSAEDTLWIAVAGSGETGTGGSFTGITAAPTNYTDYDDSGISADVVGGIESAVAFRQLNTASEDVGTFSVDVSNARNTALVIAIRPAPVVVVSTPFARQRKAHRFLTVR